ncbi:MAG: helix-turn-helix domain-containing protein [Methanosarcina sp.]
MQKNKNVLIISFLFFLLILKAYKYRIYPTKYQKRVIKFHFGCCRHI